MLAVRLGSLYWARNQPQSPSPSGLAGEPDTRPYRVAAVLLLLYAQPLVRVAAMRTEQIQVTPSEILSARPNMRTADTDSSPWLFPSTHAGRHLHPQSIMDRLHPRHRPPRLPQRRPAR